MSKYETYVFIKCIIILGISEKQLLWLKYSYISFALIYSRNFNIILNNIYIYDNYEFIYNKIIIKTFKNIYKKRKLSFIFHFLRSFAKKKKKQISGHDAISV